MIAFRYFVLLLAAYAVCFFVLFTAIAFYTKRMAWLKVLDGKSKEDIAVYRADIRKTIVPMTAKWALFMLGTMIIVGGTIFLANHNH